MSGFPPPGLGSRGLLSQGTTGADGGGEVCVAQPLVVSAEMGGCELVLRNHDVWLAQSSLQAAARPHVPASSRCSVLPAGGSRASRPRVFTLLSAWHQEMCLQVDKAQMDQQMSALSTMQKQNPSLLVPGPDSSFLTSSQEAVTESGLRAACTVNFWGQGPTLPSPGSPAGAGPELLHTAAFRK